MASVAFFALHGLFAEGGPLAHQPSGPQVGESRPAETAAAAKPRPERKRALPRWLVRMERGITRPGSFTSSPM